MNELHTACAYVEKGGVGKSTTIAHTGVALAREGHSVLLIDLAGKQGDLAKSFGVYEGRSEAWPNISTVFKPEWDSVVSAIGEDEVLYATDDADFDSLVTRTGEGVDLIPSHEGLDSIDSELGNKYDGMDRYTQLDSFLSEFVSPRYDVCLLDLPGAPNNVTYNGVFAARNVIVPVQAGMFEATQILSLDQDLETIRDNFGRDVDLTMLIPNMTDPRTSMSIDNLLERLTDTGTITDDQRERYGATVAPQSVPRSQDIVNAQADGKTVFALEEPSSTAQRAIEAYERNAAELIHRIRGIPA